MFIESLLLHSDTYWSSRSLIRKENKGRNKCNKFKDFQTSSFLKNKSKSLLGTVDRKIEEQKSRF